MLKKLLANLLASILTLVAMVVPLQAQSITLTFNSQVLEPTVAPVYGQWDYLYSIKNSSR